MSGFSQDSMRYITTAAGGGIEAPGSPQYFIAYRDNAAWGGGTYYAIDSSGNIETMFTAGGGIGGGGTLNYIPKYTPDGTHLGNSLLFDNGTSVLFGGTTAIASAGIAMTSTSQGFLAPRMTTAQRNAIAAPATGLLVYNTSTSLFCYYDGATWQNIDSQAGGDVSGSGTTDVIPRWTDGPNSVLGDSVISQSSGGVIITQTVNTTGSPTALRVVGGAHTTLTASTESIGANFNFSATKQFATGAITTQREFLIQAPTYAFVAASTITTAATLAISAAPIAGTNATITNSLALWVQSGETRLVGSATSVSTYALRIHNSSGTNNSLVVNNAGFVGIGIAATLEANLHIVQAVQAGTSAPTAFLLTGGAHTTLAAGFESIGARFNFAQTKQWATGAIAIQREIYIEAPTYAFVAASTITTAATFAISSAPTAGTNATITNPLALWVQSGESRFTGSGTTSATYVLRTYNSTPTEVFSVRNDGYIYAGVGTSMTIGLDSYFSSALTGNTFVGIDIGGTVTAGNNTAFGYRAGAGLTSGANNVFIGSQAGTSVATNNDNVIIGYLAGAAAGSQRIAIGYAASNINTNSGVAIGYNANGGTGAENTVIGYNTVSGYAVTAAQTSTLGQAAMQRIGSGAGNTAVGANSGAYVFLTAANNTYVGNGAGQFNNDLGSNVGTDARSTNTFIGAISGNTNRGNGGIGLGYYAAYYETADNKLFIDNQNRTSEALSRTNSLVYGVFNATVTSQTITFNANADVNGRMKQKQGADVASAAGAIALGYDGNTFEITGTNAITLISNLGWQNGSEVTLMFTSTATLTNGTATSGTDITMLLAGAANFVASANDVVTLVLGEIGGTQAWREKCRSVN